MRNFGLVAPSRPEWADPTLWQHLIDVASPYVNDPTFNRVMTAGLAVSPGIQRAWKGLAPDERLRMVVSLTAAQATPGGQYSNSTVATVLMAIGTMGMAYIASAAMAATSTAFLAPEAAAGTAADLTPITVTAAPIIPTAEVAAAAEAMGLPSIATLANGSVMLSFPELGAASLGTVNALADSVVSSVNTPAMQAAIASGAVPPPPTSLIGETFKKWAIGTGLHAVEQQLGRALTPDEQIAVERDLAAEISKRQAALAAQGAPGSYDGLVKIGLAAAAAIVAFTLIR